MDFRRPRLPLPAAAVVPAHAGGSSAGVSAGVGTGPAANRPSPCQDLPAEPHLLRQRGPGQPGAEPGAAGRGASSARHRPARHPAAVGAAAGPPAPPATVRGHGARLRRGRLQHRRWRPLPPARRLRPPRRHRPARPQVAAAEPAAAGGPAGRCLSALPHRPAQLLAPVRGSRGAGGGPSLGGRPALRRLPLGLRPAQLPWLRPLQPGQLLRPLPHLCPHHPPPGQPHRGGQPPALPPALQQPAERAQLPGHRADAGWGVHVPPAAARREALGSVAGPCPPQARVGMGWPRGRRRALGTALCVCASGHGPACTHMCWCAWHRARVCVLYAWLRVHICWCAWYRARIRLLLLRALYAWVCAQLCVCMCVPVCTGPLCTRVLVCTALQTHISAGAHGHVQTEVLLRRALGVHVCAAVRRVCVCKGLSVCVGQVRAGVQRLCKCEWISGMCAGST